MKQTTKRYLISSLITFFTAFAVVLLAEIDNITLESLKDGALIGIGFTCFRAGIKALLEWFLATFNV